MHLSQEQLARLLGVDRSTISSYESNVRQPPLDTLSRIADVFGVSTDYLLGADSGYLGNTNLSGKYLGDTTLHDVVYELQQLDTADRRDLLKYIQFLKHDD